RHREHAPTAQCPPSGQAPGTRLEPDHDPGARQQSAEVRAHHRGRAAHHVRPAIGKLSRCPQGAGGGDIKEHQVRTYSAMQQALKMLLDDLDPQAIEEAAGSGMLSSRKSRAWDTYSERWK